MTHLSVRWLILILAPKKGRVRVRKEREGKGIWRQRCPISYVCTYIYTTVQSETSEKNPQANARNSEKIKAQQHDFCGMLLCSDPSFLYG